MRLEIGWSPAAAREREHLDRAVRERIIEAIQRFALTGYGDVVSMKGKPGQNRLRVGDYRVRFTIDHASETMVIQGVAHRREAYR